MLHTHQYQFYPVDSYQNVLKSDGLWAGECDAGHANCVFGSDEHYINVPVNETGVAYLETNKVPNDIHHTHKIHIINPSGTTGSILHLEHLQDCALAHTDCRNQPMTWSSMGAIATGATEITVSTGDAIWSGNSHYHQYYISNPSYSAVLGFTTCPGGHANCKVITTGAPFYAGTSLQQTDSFEGEPPPPLSPPADNTIVKPKVSLEAIRNIEMSTMGRIYVDEQGNFTYESRYARNP